MRLSPFLVLLMAIFPAWAIAQPTLDTLVLHRVLPVQARFATTDNLGNIYIITPKNAIEKYSPEGQLLTRYSTNRTGIAAAIDATNPLKVIVWYADFRVVAFFDRSLTPLGEINLIHAGYPEVRTVAAAADGNLWLYDEVVFQLKKISPEGTKLAESQRLNALFAERLPIEALRDDGSQVYAFSPPQGLLCFDTYGQFRHRLPIPGAIACIAADERVTCLTERTVLVLDRLRLSERSFLLPAAEQKAYRWLGAAELLVQNGSQLEVWRWGH